MSVFGGADFVKPLGRRNDGVPLGAVLYATTSPLPLDSWQPCNGSVLPLSLASSRFPTEAPVSPYLAREGTKSGGLAGVSIVPWEVQPQDNLIPGGGGVFILCTTGTGYNFIKTTDGYDLTLHEFNGQLLTATEGYNAVGLLYLDGYWYSARNDAAFSSSPSQPNRTLYRATTLAGPWTRVGNNSMTERFNNSSTWTSRTLHAMASDGVAGGKRALVGSEGLICGSIDGGASWTRRAETINTGGYRSVIWNATTGRFIAYRKENLAWSTDALNWTVVTYTGDATRWLANFGPSVVFKAGGTYYGFEPSMGVNPTLYAHYWSSPDGMTWTRHDIGFAVGGMVYEAARDRLWAYDIRTSPGKVYWRNRTGDPLVWNDAGSVLPAPFAGRTDGQAGTIRHFNGRLFLTHPVWTGGLITVNDGTTSYDMPVIAAIGGRNAYMRIK